MVDVKIYSEFKAVTVNPINYSVRHKISQKKDSLEKYVIWLII